MDAAPARERLLFVDHACHASTQSAQFLKNALAAEFEVTAHEYTRYYRCGLRSDVLRRHAYLVFFEFLPGRFRLCPNHTRSVYVPMYDNEWGSAWRWRRIARHGMSVISFCSRVSTFARCHGVSRCLDVRYFPNPADYPGMAGDPRILLLWERGQITFDTVKRLFNPGDFENIIVLRHPEERVRHADISAEDRRQYRLEIVDTGFLPRQQFLDVLRPAGTVLAPRCKEGIGMAFLEAMAMRKCVLAHRDATMDEYIRPGENGLLFDAANPARQSIAEVVAIHQHLPDPTAYYRRWLEDAQRIAPFIRETPPVRLSTAQRMADLFLYLLFLGETALFRMRSRAVSVPGRNDHE